MENKCLACRFGSVKVEIVVPEKYNMKQFVQETRDFASDIAGLTRKKPIHYSMAFGSGDDCRKKLDFKVDCNCVLDMRKEDCSKFNLNAGRVTHLGSRETLKHQTIAIPVRKQ